MHVIGMEFLVVSLSAVVLEESGRDCSFCGRVVVLYCVRRDVV